MLPFTVKMLENWAGTRVFREGRALFNSARVCEVDYNHPNVEGAISRGDRAIQCRFTVLKDGTVDNNCPCRDSTERGIICAHVIALALALIERQNDPERLRRAEEEKRRAERMAAYDEAEYLTRVTRDFKGAEPARLRLELADRWHDHAAKGQTRIHCAVQLTEGPIPVDEVARDRPLLFDPPDEALLFVLEDIAGGPIPAELTVKRSDFINILKLLKGRKLYVEAQREPITVNAADMRSVLQMNLDTQTGELILMVHTELPFMNPDGMPLYVIEGKSGWVYDAGHFWPLENLLPPPLHGIYEKPVCVERPSVPRFLQKEMPLIEQYMPVITDVSADLLTVDPGSPSFFVEVRGSPASLAATLYAEYETVRLVAGKADPAGHFAQPDSDDVLRYTVRNPYAEEAALDFLQKFGFEGKQGDKLSSIVGCREVLNFLGTALPRIRRVGWRVELVGKVAPLMEAARFVVPVVHIEEEDEQTFTVYFTYEGPDGQHVPDKQIQRAIMREEAYLHDGEAPLLLDIGAVEAARAVFRDCATLEADRPGAFRMQNIYAAYVAESLAALDGIDVEAPPSWQEKARRQNRKAPDEEFAIPTDLAGVLRPYQAQGVRWLRFLEENLFCGILADEMGLGKTLQAITWLSAERALPSARGRPSLVVCPTSLVENWNEEIERFAPHLRALVMSGPDRHAFWDLVPEHDVVITSYALLRRDIDHYRREELSAAVLDEAQHIKNRATQNAQAAKRLRAAHRLVLTGTPMENSVADLWSIMDFLMPGYLGGHEAFHRNYELPVAQGGFDGEEAKAKLRRKLNPFLLRRLKTDVAKDLPPKIERIAHCTLTRAQQKVYEDYLEESRREISELVAEQGFNASRMHILKTLLRLRQICCHLELLKRDDIRTEYPSGKLDLFLELLDEALDAEHRVLVFSQFTSLLAILRRELEAQNLRYCYLDGSTKNRMEVVREFNTNRSIPVFLMSLKAGGTGLNLTGADMVIHFDPWWNPAVENQATDRAHRIGQKRTVYSVKLITKNTVEERVLRMQRQKKALIDATVTATDHGAGPLSWEDVCDILAM
jgi:hypothetical protein